ncbi:TaqI-like C-terminal specificity domain-containing protein [Thermodesulfobium acidiphilum]|uniref:TaqI-like C-terminal specificity domain-containing protein n=1 Tax=Thermodesulfobium acidiphilum TaxID=1794699 RepID=UPI000D347C05|nr:TaqI-like C-terminal specificity domain-containing protein [Thermodesulfobium acidiphilum]
MNTYIKNEFKDIFSYSYILGILNSKLSEWFYYWFVYNRAIRTMHFDKYYIGKLPIKKIDTSNQNIVSEIESKVEDILTIKQKDSSSDTSQLQREIDGLVYQLYDLIKGEIKIIEKGVYNRDR